MFFPKTIGCLTRRKWDLSTELFVSDMVVCHDSSRQLRGTSFCEWGTVSSWNSKQAVVFFRKQSWMFSKRLFPCYFQAFPVFLRLGLVYHQALNPPPAFSMENAIRFQDENPSTPLTFFAHNDIDGHQNSAISDHEIKVWSLFFQYVYIIYIYDHICNPQNIMLCRLAIGQVTDFSPNLRTCFLFVASGTFASEHLPQGFAV